MRVLLLAGGFPTDRAPQRGIFSARMAMQLIDSGCEVRVVHFRTWRPGRRVLVRERYRGVDVARVALPLVLSGVLSRARHAYNRALLGHVAPRAVGLLGPVDVVHSVSLLVAAAGGRWARRLGAAHVVQLITEPHRWLSDPGALDDWDANVHALACNSEYIVREIRSLFPAAPNVRCIYRGTNLRAFCPERRGASGGVRFLYMGGFPRYFDGDDIKGGRTLLRAWRERERELCRLDARLTVTGPGVPDTVPPGWLRSLAEPARVRVERPLAPDSVPGAMRDADVVVVPSRHEGLPNVAVEASASGCAVLGTTAGGIPEIVDDGVTGRLVAPGDAAALGEAMVELATERAHAAAMGERARARAERLFDAAAMPERLLALYRDACAERARS